MNGDGKPVLQIRDNFVAFDSEISKILPGDFRDWKFHRPLGISCAALQFNDEEPVVWFSKTSAGEYAAKMNRVDIQNLVRYMEEAVSKGWVIVTWNGLGCDFDVLAEESGLFEECRLLALNHIDVMYHFFCITGYPLGLDKAAKGMGLEGKMQGMSGDLAPILWNKGEYETVIKYVSQDVKTTIDIAKEVQNKGYVAWTSNSGKYKQILFPDGLYPVYKATQVSSPNTDWIDTPMRREDFFTWALEKHDKKNEVPPSELSEDEINDQLCLTENIYDEIDVDFEGYPVEKQKQNPIMDVHNKTNGLFCTCPICRGEPNLDDEFKYLFDDVHENYLDDY